MTSQTSVPDLSPPLDALAQSMASMSPQVRKAAAFVLDHPDDVGFSSVRELASAAGVKPNTLVRMAQAAGFDGFDDFREAFRNRLRLQPNFTDRAAWLREVAGSGKLGGVYADIAGAAIENVERTFAAIEAEDLKAVADRIVASRRTYVVGVGANFALAQNFAYLTGMAVDNVVAVPRQGNVPMDTIVRAGGGDVVIAVTFDPYRSEVVEAAAAARMQGATIVAVTDSHGSPIAAGAEFVFLTPSAGPQFFPSTLGAAALLETLASFVVADATDDVVEAIDRFHQRRYDFGVYWRDDR